MRPLRRAHERLDSEAKADAWSESHAHFEPLPLQASKSWIGVVANPA